MTRFLALAILSLVIFTSCENKTETAQQHVSKYYDDGRARPVVAVGTVIDSTSYDLPWSISKELTHLVQKQLSTNQNIFLAAPDEIDEFLTNSDNPFDVNISWMKDRFEPNEFLVFLELINHNELKKDNITNLDMAVRIRIVDVRAKPRVILQECLTDNYYIAKGSIKEDYQNTVWGSSEYENSRMGMAHKQLAKDISDRISDYIALSKSR